MSTTSLFLALVMVLISGCSTVTGAFKSNEANIAVLAPLVTGPGCQAAASTLQRSENQIICNSLQACNQSFCNAAVVPVPTATPNIFIPTVTTFQAPTPSPVH